MNRYMVLAYEDAQSDKPSSKFIDAETHEQAVQTALEGIGVVITGPIIHVATYDGNVHVYDHAGVEHIARRIRVNPR